LPILKELIMSRLGFALSRRARFGIITLFVFAGAALAFVNGQTPEPPKRVTGANFKQAQKYSDAFLRQFTYSVAVEPQWIGKGDSFWYEYHTSTGKQWYKVQPKDAKKTPLFDRSKLAAQLSVEVRKPLDPLSLPITRGSLSEDGGKFKFVTETTQFEYDLAAEKLTKLGPAPKAPTGIGAMSPAQQQQLKDTIGEERFKQLLDEQKSGKGGGKKKGESFEDEALTEDERLILEQAARLGELQFDDEADPLQKKGGGKGGGKGPGVFSADYRTFAPDETIYAFVKNHNLYVAEADKEDQAIQLTKDGADDYTFAGGGFGFGGLQQQEKKDDDKELIKVDDLDKKETKPDKEKKTRAPVTWAKDSKAFYVLRRDSRGIKDLFLVNSIAEPRPTLMKYQYPMPGDENIRRSELHVFNRDKKTLVKIERKWKDESYSDLHWGKTSADLRFLRTDRPVRNIDFCTYDVAKNEAKCLIGEGFENSNITPRPMRYLDESDEMIWWSERTGWGHFYLYDRAGKLKNAITAGDFRASVIVALDTKNRVVYFRGNAREPGENVYQNHLYSVKFDGTALTLLDPGDADHDSRLSPSRAFVVDNCSRTDMAPISVLRDARGNELMPLEKADMSKLREIGWKMPETFVVKAADGVTDLYGNLYKPFDFDPAKKYPIIAHVYPGPQTESMSHSFKAYTSQQQLAQLGFIVIQVGNRGGSPLRSKAYQNFSYWNLRDYGLADKRFALEQLAAKHSWMDIERVGIYGHSGGGFMSAAAMLVKPYNDFFKVAVASAGNHDNNIYNNTWSERYHGLKEVPIEAKDAPKKGEPTKAKSKLVMPMADQTVEGKKDGEKKSADTRWEIKVPTNGELAGNLKGKLLLVHGDMDNNVHPGNTIRLADALIKANKRFDMLILPGRAHAFGPYQPYFTQRIFDYFAEHLLEHRTSGADLMDRSEVK